MGGIIEIRDEIEFCWKSQSWVYDLIVVAMGKALSDKNPQLSKLFSNSSTYRKGLPYLDLRELTLEEKQQTLAAFVHVRKQIIEGTVYPEENYLFTRADVVDCVTELIKKTHQAITLEKQGAGQQPERNAVY